MIPTRVFLSTVRVPSISSGFAKKTGAEEGTKPPLRHPCGAARCGTIPASETPVFPPRAPRRSTLRHRWPPRDEKPERFVASKKNAARFRGWNALVGSRKRDKMSEDYGKAWNRPWPACAIFFGVLPVVSSFLVVFRSRAIIPRSTRLFRFYNPTLEVIGCQQRLTKRNAPGVKRA